MSGVVKVPARPAPAKPTSFAPVVPRRIFRQCACGGTCAACKPDHIQRKALSGLGHDASSLPVSQPHDPAERAADRMADAALRTTPADRASVRPATARGSGGSPLSDELRAYFEPRFGHELGAVRVHTDGRAIHAARALHAEAFAIGGDIHFGEGAFAPGSERGRRLIAHELAHVVQQGTAPTIHRQPKTDHSVTDNEIDALLPDQAAADAEEATEAAAVSAPAASAPAAAPAPYKPPPAWAGGVRHSIWEEDHATVWKSFRERSKWVKAIYDMVQFTDEMEQEYYAFIAQGIDIDHPRKPMSMVDALPGHQFKSSSRFSTLDDDDFDPFGKDKPPTDESRFWFNQKYEKGPRKVHYVEFTTARHEGAAKLLQPDFMAPVIFLSQGDMIQRERDPSAGWNFDTYLINRATNQKIPAQSLGGTRFRVLMGSPQCPGCHFGHGLEVDLFGGNFVIVLGTMTLSGLGAIGGGMQEPVPSGPEAPPGGWTGPRGPSIPGGRTNLTGATTEAAPAGGGTTASGGGPYTGGAAAPKVAPQPAAPPAPAPAPLKSVPMPTTPAPAPKLGPGPSPLAPTAAALAAATQKTSQNTQQNICPQGAKKIIWPLPLWAGAGFNDTGAVSPVNNRPSTFVITRVKPTKRSRSLIRQYLNLNLPLVAKMKAGLKGAIHHKWPLFLDGKDQLNNLVFLTNPLHVGWHNTLHAQGKNGWMTFDPLNTKYCVY